MVEITSRFLCRTCLQEYEENDSNAEFTSILSIFQIDSKEIRIVDMILICLSVQLSDNDQMSLVICTECINKLYSCFEFKRQIEQSETHLQELVSSQSNQFPKFITNYIDDQYDESPATNITEFRTQHNRQELYFCEICLSQFETENMLQLHFKEHITDEKISSNEVNNGAICPINNTEIIGNYAASNTTSKRECFTCEKRFPNISKLNNHILHKHNVNILKPYQCDSCSKSYTTLYNLTLHINSHRGIKQFCCDICNKKFMKKLALECHMAIHTGIRKHLCRECGRCFTSASILQQHRKTHFNIKQFKCIVCSRGFYKSNDLREHVRTHTGEKPYLCSSCGRGFARITHLNIHYRTHSGEKPYGCPHCNRAFTQSGDLKIHIRTHTGEKPYHCKICNKRFNQSSGLKSHAKSHTGERNYSCKVCSKTFTQSSSLSRHTKAHK